MNPMALHFMFHTHHQDLLREAEQQRAAYFARQVFAPLPRPPVVVQLPAVRTPCPTC